MCLANINIITKLYKQVVTQDDITKYEMPFDTIVAKTIDDEMYIEDFYIVSDFNLLWTNNEEKAKDNVVNNKGKLQVLLRISRLSTDSEKQLNLDLHRYDIDLSDESIVVSKACVPYILYEKILKVGKILLSPKAGLGNYVIKTLVRTNDEDNWNIQNIIPLRIE